MTKFVASLTEVNKDTDVLVEDVIAMGTEGIEYFVNEAIDRKDEQEVFVVADDMVMAENVATVLNTKFEEEMGLMKDAKLVEAQEEKVVVEVKEAKGATVRSKASVKKFLKEEAAKLANAKVAPAKKETTKTEEEKEMKTNTTMGGRRRLSSTVAKSEGTATNQTNEKEVVNVKKEVKGTEGTTRRRLSTGVTGKDVTGAPIPAGRKRLGRTESIRQQFKKFEGPWYLNAELYPVLNRLEDILANMADSELGITDIVLVEPTDIRRYERRTDILVIIQIKANGNILEFPIKSASVSSNSDLNSTSIGWVEYGGKVVPQFGFYRSNLPLVDMKCNCGNEMKNVSANNLYCYKCRTRHEDLQVTVEESNNSLLTKAQYAKLCREFSINAADYFAGKLDQATMSAFADFMWTTPEAKAALQNKKGLDFSAPEVVFQTIPNLHVPKETLALVMAIAQYDAGLPMHGVVAE